MSALRQVKINGVKSLPYTLECDKFGSGIFERVLRQWYNASSDVKFVSAERWQNGAWFVRYKSDKKEYCKLVSHWLLLNEKLTTVIDSSNMVTVGEGDGYIYTTYTEGTYYQTSVAHCDCPCHIMLNSTLRVNGKAVCKHQVAVGRKKGASKMSEMVSLIEQTENDKFYQLRLALRNGEKEGILRYDNLSSFCGYSYNVWPKHSGLKCTVGYSTLSNSWYYIKGRNGIKKDVDTLEIAIAKLM